MRHKSTTEDLSHETVFCGCRLRAQPVWYLLADNEGHGFKRKANADFEFYATVRFLETTLLE